MSDLDPRTRFTKTADAYARWRPDYPEAAIAWLKQAAQLGPDAHVVDLGTGTGILARQLAARGHRVTGVDPNGAMLERARAEGGDVTYVVGEATQTGLPDHAADLVVAAQAFHWFPLTETIAELHRILKPNGVAAAMWNVRGDTPFMRDYEELLRRLEIYRDTPLPGPTMAALDARPELTRRSRFETPHAQRLDRQGLQGRAMSSSYVAHAPHEAQQQISDALDALFDAHASDGEIVFAYVTSIRAFGVGPSLAPAPVPR